MLKEMPSNAAAEKAGSAEHSDCALVVRRHSLDRRLMSEPLSTVTDNATQSIARSAMRVVASPFGTWQAINRRTAVPARRSPRPKSCAPAGSDGIHRTQTGPVPTLKFAPQRDAATVRLNGRPRPAARLSASQVYGGGAMEEL